MGQFVRIMLLTSVLVVTGALVAVAQPPAPSKPKPAPAASSHKMITPDQIKWGPAPPSLPPGAQLAVLDGDPASPARSPSAGNFRTAMCVRRTGTPRMNTSSCSRER